LIVLERQSVLYPFLAALREPIERLGDLTARHYTFYLTDLRSHEDELFEMKEQVSDPIRRFMSGAQREIYDEVRRFLEVEEANFGYLEGDKAARLREILADPQVYTGNRMQEAKRLLDALQKEVEARVAQEREATVKKLRDFQERLESTDEFAALTEAQQETLRAPFDELAREFEHHHLIAVMRDTLRRFEDTRYPALLHRMTEWAARDDARHPPSRDETDADVVRTGEREVQYVTRTSLAVDFDKPWLADEADVDRYLDMLRKALMKVIKAGKRINI